MRASAPLLALLLLALAASPAAAQEEVENETPPGLLPTPVEAPGPQSSLEDQAGLSYGIAILVGTLTIAILLAIVLRKQPPTH